MVCPCVLPILATTSAGGAVATKNKNKKVMWGFILVSILLTILYILYLRMKQQPCSICKLKKRRIRR